MSTSPVLRRASALSVLALLSRSLPVRYFEFVPGWAETSARHHARIDARGGVVIEINGGVGHRDS